MKPYVLSSRESQQFNQNIENWKTIFKEDLKIKMREADIEYKKYKEDENNNMIHLQEACEKLYSAVENFLMAKYDKQERGYQAISYRVMNNEKDSSLLNDAVQLHYFFYNGEVSALRQIAERRYNSVRDKLKARLR